MLDAETQRRELQGVAACPSRITPTRCQFLSNPLSFNLLNRFSVTRTQFCFRQAAKATALTTRHWPLATAFLFQARSLESKEHSQMSQVW